MASSCRCIARFVLAFCCALSSLVISSVPPGPFLPLWR
jgi:hypothetical protein